MDDSDSLKDFENLFGFTPLDVRVCRPRLRAAILNSGTAQLFDGTNTRVLDAGRTVQPLIHTTRAPGLLGIIQPLVSMLTPRYVLLELYVGKVRQAGDRPVWEHLYKVSEVGTAIEKFLQGASPNAQVILHSGRNA